MFNWCVSLLIPMSTKTFSASPYIFKGEVTLLFYYLIIIIICRCLGMELVRFLKYSRSMYWSHRALV